jgi:hypothetical protein
MHLSNTTKHSAENPANVNRSNIMSNANTNLDTSARSASIAAQYLATWNELNAERRKALIATTFSPDAAYIDPMMRSAGHDGIDAMIAAVQVQFSGLHFQIHGTPDGHNNLVRFSWKLGAQAGEPVAYGTDVVEIADDGRIANVSGFLDATTLAA